MVSESVEVPPSWLDWSDWPFEELAAPEPELEPEPDCPPGACGMVPDWPSLPEDCESVDSPDELSPSDCPDWPPGRLCPSDCPPLPDWPNPWPPMPPWPDDDPPGICICWLSLDEEEPVPAIAP